MYLRLLIIFLSITFVTDMQTVLPPTTQPSVVHAESLEYPRVALFAQIVGDVNVAIKIASDGGVRSATAMSGHDFLRRAAEENAKRWRFQPGSDQMFHLTYHFKLEDPAVRDPHTECSFDLPDEVTVVANRQAVVGRP